MTLIVARIMWLAPAILLVIAVSLIGAGQSQRTTLESGQHAVARVVDVKIRNRADVTYGHIDLRIPSQTAALDSLNIRLPLPLSLLNGVTGDKTLDVRLLEGSDQPVMIERIARAQWKMSFIHAAMCLFAALLIGWGVFLWNRYLTSRGDPAQATGED